MRPGESALVYGAGTIGQLIAEAAKLRGAKYVAVVNRTAAKLETARRNGADEVIHAPDGLPCETVIERVGADRVDVVFDTVATEASLGCSARTLRKGGRLVVVGTPAEPIQTDIGIVMFNELKILGSLKYRNSFPEAIRTIEQGGIHAAGYISASFPLEDVENAFREIDRESARYLKCLITPAG